MKKYIKTTGKNTIIGTIIYISCAVVICFTYGCNAQRYAENNCKQIGFTIGEVVQLNNGGPEMLIARCESNKYIVVQWIDNLGTPQAQMYDINLIHKVNNYANN